MLLDLWTHLTHAQVLGSEVAWTLIGDAHPASLLAAHSADQGTSVGVMKRIVAMRGPNAHLFFLLTGMLGIPMSTGVALPAVYYALPVDSLRGLVSLKSELSWVNTALKSLSIGKSLSILLINLVSRGFYHRSLNLHPVWRICWELSVMVWKHSAASGINVLVSNIYRVLGVVSTNRSSLIGPISLALRSSFFHNSGKVGCYVLATLVDIWIQHFIWIVCMTVSVLIHHYLWLVRCLSLLELIKSFVKLDISKLLFNASMGILSDIPVGISLSTGLWIAICHSMVGAWSESTEHVRGVHRWIVEVRCLSYYGLLLLGIHIFL